MRLQKAIHTLTVIAILLLGLMITLEAAASEPGTVCIQRATAEACRKSIESFDTLATEAQLVRRQRDEAQGAREKLRYLYGVEQDEAKEWQRKAEAAQAALDKSPSRLVWFGAGAAVGVVTTVVVFVLVR